MFHSRKLNTRISRFHERFLQVVFTDFDSSFEKLLRKDSSTTLHQRNLQKLMTAIFRVKTGIAPELMKGVFEFLDLPYNLRNQSKCSRSIPCTEKYGTETPSSMGQSSYRKLKKTNLLRNFSSFFSFNCEYEGYQAI